MVGDMRLVGQECCNYINKSCIGMNLKSRTRFREEGKCWIAQAKPCPYYDAYIAPLAIHMNKVK